MMIRRGGVWLGLAALKTKVLLYLITTRAENNKQRQGHRLVREMQRFKDTSCMQDSLTTSTAKDTASFTR